MTNGGAHSWLCHHLVLVMSVMISTNTHTSTGWRWRLFSVTHCLEALVCITHPEQPSTRAGTAARVMRTGMQSPCASHGYLCLCSPGGTGSSQATSLPTKRLVSHRKKQWGGFTQICSSWKIFGLNTSWNQLEGHGWCRRAHTRARTGRGTSRHQAPREPAHP